MPLSELWIVFSLSFVTALSGALMPGPLLTYTIARTLRTTRAGWFIGVRVVAGHAALEGVLLCGLVLGVVEFLRNPLAAKIIGVLGAALLLYMGIGLLRETIQGKGIDLSIDKAPAGKASMVSRLNPVLAGALVSMGNPYWWIWWVTIGSAFLLRFNVTWERWQALLAFFIGHELGDLGWYTFVSTALHLGRKSIPRGATMIMLAVCGIAIIGFGAYLGISPFLAH
ncbi:MAG: LysE family transporter [Spirochaetia bacterium]|jgi:threonine/homoserine/homoserine lactone efflux protein